MIETERLVLRGHRLDDYPHSAAMWADANVVKHISGKPSPAQQSWMRLLNYAGHWSLLGFGYWAIEERISATFVGEVGFADFKRDVERLPSGVPEIGWVLANDVRGRGFATEAVRAVLDWSDRNLPWERTYCIIVPENVASINVAVKCGYREIERVDFKGDETILFTRNKHA